MKADREREGETDKCADCGREMTKEEGGTVFTVCSQCWDKKPLRPAGEMVPSKEAICIKCGEPASQHDDFYKRAKRRADLDDQVC